MKKRMKSWKKNRRSGGRGRRSSGNGGRGSRGPQGTRVQPLQGAKLKQRYIRIITHI